jgi:adenylate kinase family enzyme
MQRIAIIGNAGGGKSVFARRLSMTLALPLRVVDDVQWRPGWAPAPAHEIAHAHAQWLEDGRWVIDGWGSWPLIEERFAAADAIVLIDYPIALHYWWAAKRQVRATLGIRGDWPPPGCRAWPVTVRLARLMWRVHREMRPRLLDLAHRPEFHRRLRHVRAPRALDAVLAEAKRMARVSQRDPRHELVAAEGSLVAKE